MAVERISGGSSLIDVLDRVLDKGIVIDAWVRISGCGRSHGNCFAPTVASSGTTGGPNGNYAACYSCPRPSWRPPSRMKLAVVSRSRS